MGVAARDHHQMDQGMRGQEAGTCSGGRPISRAPCPCGEREAGHEEGYADVLDEMRIEGPVSDTPGTVSYQRGPATSIASPLKRVGIARMAAIRRRMGTSCGQDERVGSGVTELVKEISGPFRAQICGQRGPQTGVNFALGKPDKTR
jgi:hypothetical protein